MPMLAKCKNTFYVINDFVCRYIPPFVKDETYFYVLHLLPN